MINDANSFLANTFGVGQKFVNPDELPKTGEMDTQQLLGIQTGTFKQGILNAIGRWNSLSRSSNLLQGKFLKSNKIDYDSMREGRIKQALREILEMPNLGRYGVTQAYADFWTNSANQAIISTTNLSQKIAKKLGVNKTKGGKKRKMRKTRKNNRK